MESLSIVDVFRHRVDRELRPDELEMFRHLSAQGVAKINADFIQGVAAENTLATLRTVYEATQLRRRKAIHALCPRAQTILQRLVRPTPFSTDEMMLLDELCTTSRINDHLCLDGSFDENFDFEDAALHFQWKALTLHADRLANSTGRDVAPCDLVSVNLPSNLNAMTVARTGQNNLSVGLSPLVTWFDELSAEPLQVVSPIPKSPMEPAATTTRPSSIFLGSPVTPAVEDTPPFVLPGSPAGASFSSPLSPASANMLMSLPSEYSIASSLGLDSPSPTTFTAVSLSTLIPGNTAADHPNPQNMRLPPNALVTLPRPAPRKVRFDQFGVDVVKDDMGQEDQERMDVDRTTARKRAISTKQCPPSPMATPVTPSDFIGRLLKLGRAVPVVGCLFE